MSSFFRRSPVYAVACSLLLLLNLSAGAQEKAEALDLREVMRQGSEQPPFEATRLSPEWVGEIRTEGAEPSYLRLSHALRPQPKEGKAQRIRVMRMSSKGEVSSGGEVAQFYESLPETASILTADYPKLVEWFGPNHGWFDSWGDLEQTMYWDMCWTCFARTEDGNLRWLRVFASLSAKGDERDDDKLVHVDKIRISEGLLRPADPSSAEEQKLFKTADQIESELEAARVARLAKLPQPLRDLVTAFEAPYDSYVTYHAAVSHIRQQPDLELFRQIAAFDGAGYGEEGKMDYDFFLQDILLDNPNAKVEPWTKENRAKAMRQAVEALPKCFNAHQLETQVYILLEALGGGHVSIESPRIDLALELKPGGDGKTTTYSEWEVEDANLRQAADALVDWFKGKL